MQSLLFLLPFFFWTLLASAQDNYRLLDQATLAICEQDTAEAIVFLKVFLRKYPDDPLFELSKLRLGQFYLSQGKADRAIQQLQELLAAENRSFEILKRGTGYFLSPIAYPPLLNRNCRHIFNTYSFRAIKFDACKTLSNIYLQKRQFDKAVQILLLGQYKHFPHTGCGNGDFDILMRIQYDLGLIMLEKGDTSKAIAHLFRSVLYDGSPPFEIYLDKLRAVLEDCYTSAQINGLLDDIVASARVKTVQKDESFQAYFFVRVLKHEVNLYRNLRLESFQERLMRDEVLQALRE